MLSYPRKARLRIAPQYRDLGFPRMRDCVPTATQRRGLLGDPLPHAIYHYYLTPQSQGYIYQLVIQLAEAPIQSTMSSYLSTGLADVAPVSGSKKSETARDPFHKFDRHSIILNRLEPSSSLPRKICTSLSLRVLGPTGKAVWRGSSRYWCSLYLNRM